MTTHFAILDKACCENKGEKRGEKMVRKKTCKNGSSKPYRSFFVNHVQLDNEAFAKRIPTSLRKASFQTWRKSYAPVLFSP
jgi:hypothetical protein